MKSFIQLCSFLFLFLSACNDAAEKPGDTPKPENGMDAAGQFIRAALDGDYTKAKSFLVADSTNKQMIDLYEWNYHNNMTPEDKKAYHSASIRFLKETHKVNDTVTIVHYSNSYKDKRDSLKLIKTGGQWFIDLNFTFQKNDTIPE
jgi:hypothetical protein